LLNSQIPNIAKEAHVYIQTHMNKHTYRRIPEGDRKIINPSKSPVRIFYFHSTLSYNYLRVVCDKVQSSLEMNSCSEQDGYANSIKTPNNSRKYNIVFKHPVVFL
jgi:hypothetical protein